MSSRRFPASPRALLAELVACPSVNPEGDAGGSVPGEFAMGEKIAGLLRALGADVEVCPVAPGRPNVVGVFDPARPAVATVVFAPHLDTVGVKGMTVEPFVLRRRGGRLYGRGSCDTKGPAAALLHALHRWTRSAASRQGRVRWVVAATAGEEEGSLGAQALMKSGSLRADFAVALEPTGLRVVHAAKGILRVWIEVAGRAGHGSRPKKGVNAIQRLLPLALAVVDNLQRELAGRRHSLLGPATLNLGVMEGGRDINVIPDFCRIGLDIRTHPDCPAEEIRQMLEAVRRQAAPAAVLRVHRMGPAFVTPRDDPWVRRLRAVGRGWSVVPWFSDANVFAAHGVPAVAFGPGGIDQAHTRDEFIEQRALAAGAAVFGRFLTANARG